MFVVYQIAEVGMGKYYGHVAVLFDHEHPTLFLASKTGLSLAPRLVRPVVTPDGRYMYASFYRGILIIDLMKRKFTGLKLDDDDSIYYDMQPSGDTFHINHKETGKSTVILPERLTWHEGTGEQTDIEAFFLPYEQAVGKLKPYWL